jgi:hypothetical protein
VADAKEDDIFDRNCFTFISFHLSKTEQLGAQLETIGIRISSIHSGRAMVAKVKRASSSSESGQAELCKAKKQANQWAHLGSMGIKVCALCAW